MYLITAIQAAIAYGLTYVLSPLTVPLCALTGALDKPDGIRKLNTYPIPRLGGLAFFASAAFVLLSLVGSCPTVGAILTAGAILMICGVCDDTYGMPWQAKLISQVCSALVAILIAGVPSELSFFGFISIPLSGAVGFIFVLIRLVFTMNAVNFADGLDGLAAGISAAALFSLAIFGSFNGRWSDARAAFILGAAVLGFLPYNRYRARLFMGDCGSQFLGLSIAMLSLGTSRSGSFTVETSLFLAIPTLDTVFSVVRRIAKGKSPFFADKGHLHHLLLSLGVPHPDASHILVALSALIALIGLLITAPPISP